MALELRPIELKQANEFIAKLHRHHKPVVGHRFSISVWQDVNLVGVAICGRPVSRELDKLKILEVTRLCTDGTKNACSMLYAAAARAAKAIGYKRVQTYLLEDELATSVKASGWTFDGMTTGGDWNHSKQRAGKRRTDQPMCPKQRWVKDLED